MTYCRCYSCKHLLRYELKTECGQICAFFLTAGVGLIKSDNTKKMWNNINLLINKERPSSHTKKLQVDNKRYEQPFNYLQLP